MNKNSGNGKIVAVITFIASLFAICGFTLFENRALLQPIINKLFGKEPNVVVVEKETSSPSGSATIKKVSVTATPGITNSPKPKGDKKDPITPKKTKVKKTIGDNIIKVSSSPSTNPSTKTKKKKKENDEEDAEQSKSDNTQTDSPATEEPAYPDNKQDSPADQTSSTQVNIDSPGNLILTSNNKKKNSQVDISRVSEDDNSDESQDDAASFDYSEIVNDEGIENADEVVYLPVLPGTYIFVFHNCDFEDIDFYLVDDVNDSIEGESSEGTDPDDTKTEEDNVIPSSDIFQIDITGQNPSTDFTVKADQDFTPSIKFYSEENVENAGNISLVISDSEGNVLQAVQLNQQNENGTNDIVGDYKFVEGQEYSLKIQAELDQEVPDIICCLEIGVKDGVK